MRKGAFNPNACQHTDQQIALQHHPPSECCMLILLRSKAQWRVAVPFFMCHTTLHFFIPM